MDEKDVWNLFKETGNIQYYIKYKQMKREKSGMLGNKEDRRNSSI